MKHFSTIKALALVAGMLFATGVQAEDDKPVEVTIPATGHLAIHPERNFKGPAGMIVSNYYGSANANSAGISFTNQELGEGVVIAHVAGSSSGVILTAQPGKYTITYTDDASTKQFFSTNAAWTDESIATTTKDGTRIYKFVNTTEKLGWERDENYAPNYMSCAMGTDHLYFAIASGAMDRITATLETTADALTFIPWSDKWKCPEVPAPAGIQTVNHEVSTASSSFNLAGQRVAQPAKGLYIVNGQKVVMK